VASVASDYLAKVLCNALSKLGILTENFKVDLHQSKFIDTVGSNYWIQFLGESFSGFDPGGFNETLMSSLRNLSRKALNPSRNFRKAFR